MSDTEIVAELNEQFGSGNKELEADVVAELRSIMRLHQLSVEDLFFKWESYCIKMDIDAAQTALETLRHFKQDLHDTLERNSWSHVKIKTEKGISSTPRAPRVSGGDVFGMLDSLTTPGPGRASKVAPKRTPAVSRVKAEPASSPVKLADQLDATGAIP